jgi:hypothetical protein
MLQLPTLRLRGRTIEYTGEKLLESRSVTLQQTTVLASIPITYLLAKKSV